MPPSSGSVGSKEETSADDNAAKSDNDDDGDGDNTTTTATTASALFDEARALCWRQKQQLLCRLLEDFWERNRDQMSHEECIEFFNLEMWYKPWTR
jgi:hypothetical protein